MIIILPIIVLGFLFIVTYKQYEKMAEGTHLSVVPLSIYQTIFTFSIIIALYLKGYTVSTFFVKQFMFVILVFIALIFSYLTFTLSDSEREYEDLKLEILKNTIALFTKTILTFFVFMTIFRFHNVFLQVALSLLITIGLLAIAPYLQRVTKPIRSNIKYSFKYTTPKVWIFTVGPIIILALLLTAYRIPTNVLEDKLNLSQSIRIRTEDREEIYFRNNFTQEEIFSIQTNLKVPKSTFGRTFHYEYSQDELRVIIEGQNSMIHIPPTEENAERSEIGYTPVTTGYIVGERLSIPGTDLSFPKMAGKEAYYDSVNEYMYYTTPYDFDNQRLTVKESTYLRIDSEGNREEFTVNFDHNMSMLIVDGDVYLYEKGSFNIGQVEIMNDEFRINAMFSHVYPQSFARKDDKSGSFIIDYKVVDGSVEFLQLDYDGTLTLYILVENEVTLNLPFYSSYSIGIFFWIFAFLFVPQTNYSVKYTTENFKNKTKTL